MVLVNADLDDAVDATVFGSFLHQGQICMSARKIIVERRAGRVLRNLESVWRRKVAAGEDVERVREWYQDRQPQHQ